MCKASKQPGYPSTILYQFTVVFTAKRKNNKKGLPEQNFQNSKILHYLIPEQQNSALLFWRSNFASVQEAIIENVNGQVAMEKHFAAML